MSEYTSIRPERLRRCTHCFDMFSTNDGCASCGSNDPFETFWISDCTDMLFQLVSDTRNTVPVAEAIEPENAG